MTKADILTILKVDLGLISVDESRTTMLNHLIDTAIGMLTQEGVKFGTTYGHEEAQLIVMYAAYLYRKRGTDEGMPRMLRWAINNRIFGNNTVEEADTDAS